MNPTANTNHLFKNVAFVVYPVTNVEISRAFYEEVLGLAVTANWQDQWVEYDIGDGTLVITVTDAGHRPGTHGATVGLDPTSATGTRRGLGRLILLGF